MTIDNTTNNKRIAKNTLFLYFRMFFLMAVSLYTSRVILDVLGAEDYGIYNLVGGFVTMFALISSALTSACSRFLNYEIGKGESKNLNVVFSSTVTIQFILAIIIAVLCETVGLWFLNEKMVIPDERTTAANWCFQFSVINFCMNLLTVPYNAAIIAHEQMKAFAYISIFEGISKLLICYIVIIGTIDKLILFAFLLLVIQFIVRSTYQIYCLKKFPECHYKLVIKKSLFRMMFGYAGWHILGNSAILLRNQGVDLILNLFFGPVINAAKGLTNQVNHAVHGFVSNFMTAVNPQIMKSYARGDMGYMVVLTQSGSRYSYFLMLILSLPIIVNTQALLALWLKEIPEYSDVFIQLSLILSMITSISRPLTTAQDATGNVRNFQLCVSGIQLLNLPISYIFLLQGFDPASVFAIGIIVECVALFVSIILLHRSINEFSPIIFMNQVILKCLIVTVSSMILPISLPYVLSLNTGTLLLNIFVCIITSSISILYIGCTKTERNLAFSILINKYRQILK